MKRKAVSSIILTLLLVGMIAFVYKVEPVRASGTIYIRSDGSIDPPTAKISRDGDVYTLIGDIYESIVVQKSYIVIDGTRHTTHGEGWSEGGLFESVGVLVDSYTHNVTIKNMIIMGFARGIQLHHAYYITICNNMIVDSVADSIFDADDDAIVDRSHVSNNILKNSEYGINLHTCRSWTLINNTVINCTYGLFLHMDSNNNVISGNYLRNNTYGICLSGLVALGVLHAPSGNRIYHNDFVNNTNQAYKSNTWRCDNVWDDDYPSGGNYWSDYTGVDANHDGIGDTPYTIDPDNVDNYPLMAPWAPTPITGDVNSDYEVNLQDLVLIANALKSKLGDPNWNPSADIASPYGVISLTDVVWCAYHYGKHYP